MREARRQKGLHASAMPAVCVLDPDGDLMRRLAARDAPIFSATITKTELLLALVIEDERSIGGSRRSQSCKNGVPP